MTKPAVVFLTTFLLIVTLSAPLQTASAPRVLDDSVCECTATDNSCSVSIICHGGCQKYCGVNDDCWAECSGGYGNLAAETSLDISYGTNAQLASQLARISGKEISFITTSRSNQPKSDLIINLGFKKAPLWNALEFLADRGTVRIGGKDFESLRRLRRTLLAGEHVNFGVKNTPVNTFVSDLAGLTGLPLRIASGKPMAIANVELREATLDEIIARVAEQTGTRIVEDQ